MRETQGTHSTGTLQISTNFTSANKHLIGQNKSHGPAQSEGAKKQTLPFVEELQSYMAKGPGYKEEGKIGANNAIYQRPHFQCQTHVDVHQFTYLSLIVLCASYYSKYFINI